VTALLQARKILAILVTRAGDVVSREELRQALWPSDTFVDFEHSLNAAVRRLRDALGDSADQPASVETLPRRGYRLNTPVELLHGVARAPVRLHAPVRVNRASHRRPALSNDCRRRRAQRITTASAARLRLGAGLAFEGSGQHFERSRGINYALVDRRPGRTIDPDLECRKWKI
jgi:DNA-binding winged helix-turn-helix (wHTH) protein